MTRIIRRCLPGLALALALATPAVAQQSWPDLADTGSYTFAGNRLGFPSGTLTTTAGQKSAIGHLYQVSPPYAVSNLRLLFANFYVDTSGPANPERCPGNPLSIDFATVFVGGAVSSAVTDKTVYPVTFGGATSARIGDCEFIWSDPLRDASGNPVTLPAGTTYYIRSSRSVASVGEVMVGSLSFGMSTRWANPSLGDGVEYLSAPATARRASGTVAAYGSGMSPVGPAMAIGTGWDGSPVFLVLGDSIGAGVSDNAFEVAARGQIGYVQRALDDTASGRMNFLSLAVPGTKPQDQASIAPGQFRLRMRALRSIPNKPFNRILSEMGANGLFVPLAQHKAAMQDWWAFWRLNCPSCLVYQTTYAVPHASNVNNAFWTDTANQSASGETDGYPAGTRYAARSWLLSGTAGGVPNWLKVLDIDNGTMADPTTPHLWRPLAGGWTATNAVASGVGVSTGISVSGSAAPKPGDWLVFEPGTANAETRQVYGLSGSGPWTVLVTSNTGKAHAAGVTVRVAPTGDGTHPGTAGHKARADVLIARKLDGTIH